MKCGGIIETIHLYEALPQFAQSFEGKTSPEDGSAQLEYELPEEHVSSLIAEEMKEYSLFSCQNTGEASPDWRV